MKKAIFRFLALALTLIIAMCGGALGEGAGAVKDTHILGGDEFPVRFDLREYGVVTPVKFQNPWSTCWSFGGIAAAESSILTTLGMTCEEYEQATGEPFDLSEKHLAWFASRPITAQTEESQVGEGLYFTNKEDDATAAYSVGGKGVFVTTLFAAGVGPVNEAYCPYQGAEGLTEVEFNEKYPDRARTYAISQFEKGTGLSDQGLTVAQLYEKRSEMPDVFQLVLDTLYNKGALDESVTAENITCQELEDASARAVIDGVKRNAGNGTYAYAGADDWSIPDTAEDGSSNRDVYSGFTLVDGNILPQLAIKEDEKWVGINEAGMRAVKSELLKGRAVSISFYADQSLPTDEVRTDGFLNLDTWAQYTDEERMPNHAVCIVGWDDSYSRENFNAGHLPEGDGAWIVKNSWGSETEYATREDGTPIGKRAWGVRNGEGLATGYFYLSYYDKNLTGPETMTFDIDMMQAGGLMSVFAYDYMPAMFAEVNINYMVQDVNVLKTANVFTNTTDREVAVYGVSTKTASPRTRVEYVMYRLKEDAKNPEDGEYLGKRLAYYDYAGFHREALVKGEIRLKPGERIAVVVTESVTDNDGVRQYEFAANQSFTRELAQMVGAGMYGVAVVNRGESYVYQDGQWTDWFDYEKEPSDSMVKGFSEVGIEPTPDLVSTDNFSIKLYVAAEDEAEEAAALVKQAKALMEAKDDEAAVPLLQAAAGLGDAEAQYGLGLLYYNGDGVEQDYEEAVRYYRLAAEQGYRQAQCNLGFCYFDGTGVEQDYEMARKYYQLAADQGDEVAQYNLGINCYFGTGMEQDYSGAYRYFCLAAEQGYPAGIFAVGECYYLGTGVEKDLKAAAEWYRKALDAGFVPRDAEETAHINELLPDRDAASAID